MIKTETFGTFKNRFATLYVIENDFLQVAVSDFGGIIYRFLVKNGNVVTDIVCSAKNPTDYVKHSAHMGGIIGRVANRIAGARFDFNGKTYYLDKNDGSSCLHGGFNPYDYRFFDVTVIDDYSIRLSLISTDSDQGFPSELVFNVEFKLDKNKLIINFFGLSKDDTVFSPTNHSYFNLNGEGSGDVYKTLLKIYGNYVTLPNDDLVVNGKTLNVNGTAFDFTNEKTIGEGIFFDDERIKAFDGFDHNYILNSNHVATATGEKTGIILDIYSDFPGVQFYTANQLSGVSGKSCYQKHSAFCLEPQYFPNALNVESFEKPYIKAGVLTKHYIEYEINVK